MKVAVYTIAKNEAKQVQSYMEYCPGADLVVIADTGSTDGTPDLLRQAGAVVHDISVKPWRFDLARSTSLCLLPADDLAAVSAWFMGMKEKAAEHLRSALAVNPKDARLQSNAQFILADKPASP